LLRQAVAPCGEETGHAATEITHAVQVAGASAVIVLVVETRTLCCRSFDRMGAVIEEELTVQSGKSDGCFPASHHWSDREAAKPENSIAEVKRFIITTVSNGGSVVDKEDAKP
jgi:S-methylmethionine-dependent homocysteine/selenocysteine methylase